MTGVVARDLCIAQGLDRTKGMGTADNTETVRKAIVGSGSDLRAGTVQGKEDL